ncbi:transient receptor potential-gamma protein-like [Montipora foliosa]|uniref:transient receptor potential-gamma protein-like n=1 Tax=Montipora foliosa TaxID=591990 RepID=UPI0035F1FC74
MEATSILLETIGDEDVSPLNKKRSRELRDSMKEQDLEKFRAILNSPSSTKDLNYVSSSGKTLLQLAGDITEESVRNDVIKDLLNNGADLEVALLHAVRESNSEIVEILLRYHNQTPQASSKSLNEEHVTPLILAASLQNFEIVKLLLNSGFTISEPSKPHCNESNGMVTGKLASALHRLHVYRGLASPVYIAASFLQNVKVGNDPVRRACAMNQTLREMAKQEYEFSKEYEDLSSNCNEFVVALLNECRSMEEIQCIMETNVEDAGSRNVKGQFNMLEFAIATKSDKFVSHPYCQLLLHAEVYKDVSFLERSIWNRFLLILLASVMSPVLFTIWLVYESCFPNHKIAKMFYAPCVKFLIYCGLYQLFLFLLIITSWTSVYSHYAFNDWLVLSFIIGLLVDVIKDLLQLGRERFFSHVPNSMALATIVFFVSHYIIWWSASAELSRDGVNSLEHLTNHKSHEIMLVSEGFLAVGILLAFFNNLSFMQASSSVGPLLGAFVEMMIDVGKFALYFFFIFLAFAVSFTKLHTQYLAGRSYFLSHAENATSEHHIGNLGESMSVTFWALFGEIDRDNFHVPEQGFEILTSASVIIFGAFNIAAVLVALNMLIAILNESYTRISEKLDISWKFVKAKMWLRWIHKRGVLPPPINVLYVFLPVCWVVKHLASAYFPRLLKAVRKKFQRTMHSQESIKTIKEEKRREVIRHLVLRYLRQKRDGTKLGESGQEECDKNSR